MNIPGLGQLFEDLPKRGDDMQASLDRIEALLVQIEHNTRSSRCTGMCCTVIG